MLPETPPIAGFDALEADCLEIVADVFVHRDDSGDPAQATFVRGSDVDFEADYILTQPPAVQAVDFDGDELSRAEQATIQCRRADIPFASLPEDCMVDLPDSGRWNIDKLRGTTFGPNWVTIYLTRKPLVKLTARRKG